MRGFVLAAGFGTRLRPITDHLPKALVPVCGKPLITRSLEFLKKNGIDEIGVNAHYRADLITAYHQTSPIPFELFHERDAIRGTGGAYYFARDFLRKDEVFFTCNVDIVYRIDLAVPAKRFADSGWLCGLIAVRAETRGSMYYRPDGSNYCGVPMEGAPPEGALPADYVGAAFYRKEFLDLFTDKDFSVVPVWKRAGKRAGVLIVDGCYWRDIGTPDSLAGVHFDALDGKISLDPPEHLTVDRDGKRCYVATLPANQRKSIGNYAWVEAENVPEGCVIRNSVVYPGAVLPREGVIANRIITPYGEVAFGGRS